VGGAERAGVESEAHEFRFPAHEAEQRRHAVIEEVVLAPQRAV
jgi:hypothetical protein